MQELKDILREEYNKNKHTITLDSIVGMIGEVREALSTGLDGFLTERETPQSENYTWEAIPAPSVSELGWASMNSNDKGAAAKREELEQYLRQIPGSGLRVKLKNVQRMLTDPTYAMRLVSFGDTRGERIASTLAYLVFFKTLTTVITNFNAASAGFNFEAFLAVLLGGSQIPAAGASTIADLTTADGTPISLKLYQEKTVKAGGSYNDLIGDLAKGAGMMRYVVATKNLEGKDLERTGKVAVYSYDLTPENIIEILYSSASYENSELIRLPQSIISGEKRLNFKIPKMPTLESIEEKFYTLMQQEVGDAEWYDGLVAEIDYLNNRQLFRKGKPGYEGFKGFMSRTGKPRGDSPLWKLIIDFFRENEIEDVNAVDVATLVFRAQEAAREEYWTVVHATNSIGRGLGAYASARASRDFYNDQLTTKGQKQKALLLTLGAVNRGNQYELRRNDIYAIERLASPYGTLARGQKSVKIGEITIGREQVQKLLENMINDINREVFDIFRDMATLQKDLQGYFAGGLEKPELAQSAITASLAVGSKTEKVKSDVEK